MCVETRSICCHPYRPRCVVEYDVLSNSSVPVCTHVTGAEEEGTVAVLLFVVHTLDL